MRRGSYRAFLKQVKQAASTNERQPPRDGYKLQEFFELYHEHLRGHFQLTDRVSVIRNADTEDESE